MVALDSAALSVADAEWALSGPAHAVLDTNGVWLDSLVLRSSTGGMLALRGDFPERDSLRATFVADSVPLAHLGALVQSTDSLKGFASLSALLSGVRALPVLRVDGRFAGFRYGDLRFPIFTLHGDYHDRRLASELAVYRDGRTALEAEATIPVDLALARVERRLLDDSLSGRGLTASTSRSSRRSRRSSTMSAAPRPRTSPSAVAGSTRTSPGTSGSGMESCACPRAASLCAT